MKSLRLLLVAGLTGALPLFAQDATPAPFTITAVPANAQARVAPDHADWTYATGEIAKFTVTITADNEPLTGATVRYKVRSEMLPAEENAASDTWLLAQLGVK